MGQVSDILVHAVVPAMAILGWLLFGPRGPASWRAAGYGFLITTVWLVFTLVRGALVHYYPYPFMDVDANGYASVAVWVVVIIAFFWVLCAAAVALEGWVVPLLGRERAPVQVEAEP